MELFFLGLMFCEESLKNTMGKVKNGFTMAPHVFQSNLIEGFNACDNVNVTVINVPNTGSFPFNHKEIYSKAYQWGDNTQIGYLNLPLVKHYIQQKKIVKILKRKIKDADNPYLCIYSLYEPFIKVANTLKKIFPALQVCLIQPDAVPGRNDMDMYMNKKNIQKGNKLVKLVCEFDSFVLFTKYLAEALEVEDRDICIVECIVNCKQEIATKNTSSVHSCLYTGAICKEYGIVDVAKAFCNMPEYEFWICGGGDAEDEIRELAETFNNIKYFGYVDHDRVSDFQNRCSYLINPRRPSGTYTKYSFPSKTAEYMMTGKPVIMYKLEGIPDEYDDYLNYLTATEVGGIEKQLREIFRTDYETLSKKSLLGREYMMHHKNATFQAKRIIDYLRRK